MAAGEPKEYVSLLQLAFTVLGTVVGIIIIAIGITMASKYTPKQQPLILKIQSFNMSGLDVSNFLSTTNWESTLLLANQNDLLELTISKFEGSLHYNYTIPISCGVMNAIHLGPKKQRVVHMKFNSSECGGEEQPFLDDGALEEIKQDEIKGEISFIVEMKLRVCYRTGILGWDYELNAGCPKFDIRLVAGSGNGVAIFDPPKICLLPLRN